MIRGKSMMNVMLLAVFLLIGGVTASDAKNMNAEVRERLEKEAEQKFLGQCNKRRDELVGVICGCVMESIKLKMPISDFTQKNDKSSGGKMPLLEVRKFSQALKSIRPQMDYCLEALADPGQ